MYSDCLWLVYKNGLNNEKQTLLDKLDKVDAEEKKTIMQRVMQISQQIAKRSFN